MKAKEFIPATKPRNFVAKNQQTAGAGAHRDKKKEQKQGDVKHKNKQFEQGVAEGDYPDGSSIKTPDVDEWKQQYQQAVMAVKNAKTKQEYEAASDRAGRIKDLLASKGIKVGPALGQQDVEEGYTTEKQIMTRIRQIMHDRKISGTESNAGELLRLKQQLKDLRSQQDVAEGIGGTIIGGVGQFFGNKIDPLAGEIMRAHGEIAGRKAEYTIRKYMHLLQKTLKQQLDSGEKEEGVAEASDWGEPREILEDVLQTLEREVEWPLTEVMDPKGVRQLLSPVVRAVNDKLLSMDRDGNQ